MRYSTVPAINFEAHVARNREIVANLPTTRAHGQVWNPTTLQLEWQTYEITTTR